MSRYSLTLSRFLALLFTVTSQSVSIQASEKVRGWCPQEYKVQRDDTTNILTLSTPYYTIEHDLKKGGTISKISLIHGKSSNLLVRPIETSFQLGGNSRSVIKDVYDSNPAVSHTKSDKYPVVTVENVFIDRSKMESYIVLKTEYTYCWGYIKIHKEILVPKDSIRIKNLCVFSTILDPSLSDYGYRPAIRESMDPNLFSWRNGQIRQWGKIRPGTHFDMPFRTRQIPRYLVFANHGIEGIEWFMSDNLWQWDYQMTGTPGTGFCEAEASTHPLGIAVSIYPVILSQYYQLPRGGSIEIKGKYIFDYYIGLPILEGHANNPWLCYSIRGIRDINGNKIMEKDIKQWADAGVKYVTLHHDGDYLRNRIFWRDGSYPPYPQEDMKRMDEIIDFCHNHGIKIVPYFSNHELHQSTEQFKKYGKKWGRIVDNQNNLRPNYYFGSHMCLKSGWLDFLKLSVDRVLKNHDFDGVYFDWNNAMFCNNPLHMGEKTNEKSEEKGLATPAFSPTSHWDIDELIDLMEWTRMRVGQDGIIILHNTLVPMFTTENFSTQVLGMEFSYGKLSTSIPKPYELPLEWNFAGARPRGVIGYGTIARGASQWLHKSHALLALITSVTPWLANSEALEVFKLLKPLGDLNQYKFEDWRNNAVKLSNKNCYSAVYSRDGEAYILLANLEQEPQNTVCTINPDNLAFPLSSVSSCEIVGKNDSKKLNIQNLTGMGEDINLSANSVLLLNIK